MEICLIQILCRGMFVIDFCRGMNGLVRFFLCLFQQYFSHIGMMEG